MGALALLFKQAGHEVRGSDAAFDPPIGPELMRAGIGTMQGYSADNLAWGPELIVVGNAMRRENVEATAARESGIKSVSMSAALGQHFLKDRRVISVCGTHGKTTTSAICAHLLHAAKLNPGYFIGGVPKTLPSGAAIGETKRSLLGAGTQKRSPFVVEGDEYDAVYWHKHPKFLDYVGHSPEDIVLLTSIEHDHIDVYPDEASYLDAFERLVAKVPEAGLLVCDARDAKVRGVAAKSRARVVYYALEGDDTGDATPTWTAAPAFVDANGMQLFDLYAGGVLAGRYASGVPGLHNVRNALGAMAALAEGFAVPFATLRTALASFTGVRRRQDLIGTPNGVRVYDDFAHHPTAVDETLRALKSKHGTGRLISVFEPRSATACRSIHQDDYTRAFGAADLAFFAPLGRTNIPESERLDTARLSRELGAKAFAATTVDELLVRVAESARPGDTIAVLSNGAFAGFHDRLLKLLGGVEPSACAPGTPHA
jgi:UDP-N-acetylmuramate: L-alanyl-gamma-D-glutamyl-meso-diaminopimelate ligase